MPKPSRLAETTEHGDDKIVRALRGWVSSSTIDPDIADSIRSLLARGERRDLYKQPEADEIYRGLKVNIATLTRWTGLSPDMIGDEDDLDVNLKVGPRSAASGGAASWTVDLSTAEDFAFGTGASARGNYGVILIARVSDNPGVLLDLAHIVRTTGSFQRSAKFENEIIALAPVNVSALMWVRL